MVETLIGYLYESAIGRALRPLVLESRRLHRVVERCADSRASRHLIAGLVERYHIDVSEASRPLHSYTSLNDFFTRELRPGCRPIDPDPSVLVSPADGQLFLAEPIDAGARIVVKGMTLAIGELLGDDRLAAEYHGGSAAIFRLYIPDCHRLYFPCDGTVSGPREIPGHYYSVTPRPGNHLAPHGRNRRWVTRLDTSRFGTLLLVDVGGFLVGSAHFSHGAGEAVRKGQEKSVFRFGGSTLVLLAGRGTVRWEPELRARSSAGEEQAVRIGRRLGITAAASV
jgi:phosphatidylserine decarboxylase